MPPRPRRTDEVADTASRRAWRFPRRVAAVAEQDFVPRPGARVEFDFRFMGEAFPMLEWRRMLSRHWSTFETARLITTPDQGDPALRQQIAQYLRATRAARCTPEQVVLTTNIEHAFGLVAHLALDAGDGVVIEDPCLLPTRMIFRVHGANLQPVPVDADGVDPDSVARAATARTRLLVLTPSHQYPTGVTLSLPRRLRLLDWAARSGRLIVEDDRNSEYRYGDAALESLQGLDTHDVVIYVGSFQKILGSALRVAYVVVPPPLLDASIAVQSVVDTGPPPFVQAALADLMTSGLFARHQRRLQRIHRRRRDALLSALDQRFGDGVQVGPARAGHHVHVRWREYPATEEMLATALRAGVGLGPVRPLYVREPAGDPGVTMAYGGLDEPTIHDGVARLAAVLRGSI